MRKLVLTCLVFSLIFSCSKEKETINFDEQKNAKEISDINFLYNSDFMEQHDISSISITKLKDGTYSYSVFPILSKQQRFFRFDVEPGESTRCYSEECVGKELKECFDSGGRKATVEKKMVGVEVSCE